MFPPGIEDANTRQIVVFGNGMLPLYQHGDVLIVSRSAPIRIGDRLVIETRKQEVIGGILVHMDQDSVVLSAKSSGRKDLVINKKDVGFIGRIVWASQ